MIVLSDMEARFVVEILKECGDDDDVIDAIDVVENGTYVSTEELLEIVERRKNEEQEE